MESPVRTPLLRLFVTFYRYLGTHIFAIRWNSPHSVLNLFWNIFLNLLVAYRMHSLDPFQLGALVGTCDSFKPLFAYFIRLGSNYAYPVVFIINMIYMIAVGPQLVCLLDSDCFQRVYRNETRAKLRFAVVMLVGHLFFLGFLSDKFALDWSKGPPSCRNIITYVCLYVIFNYNYSLFFAVHYYQHGIHKQLQEIAHQLASPLCGLSAEQSAIDEIKKLSKISSKFSCLFSLPFLTFTVLSSFNCILMGSLFISCAPSYSMVQHSLCISLYSIFTLLQNRRILRTMVQISTNLRAKYETKRLLTYIETVDERLQSHCIRIHEMDCYVKHFRLNVYRLGAIDFALYLQVILFTLNYIVIFTQTNI